MLSKLSAYERECQCSNLSGRKLTGNLSVVVRTATEKRWSGCDDGAITVIFTEVEAGTELQATISTLSVQIRRNLPFGPARFQIPWCNSPGCRFLYFSFLTKGTNNFIAITLNKHNLGLYNYEPPRNSVH